jgi:hypothetical protein
MTESDSDAFESADEEIPEKKGLNLTHTHLIH